LSPENKFEIMKKYFSYPEKTDKVLITTLLFFSLSFFCSAQTSSVNEEIIAALNKGDVTALSTRFDQQVEVAIGKETAIYKSYEARALLIEFFKTNRVQGFELLHKGNKDATTFVIGTLKTTGGSFRVYVLTRGQFSLIQQLRIETND